MGKDKTNFMTIEYKIFLISALFWIVTAFYVFLFKDSDGDVLSLIAYFFILNTMIIIISGVAAILKT